MAGFSTRIERVELRCSNVEASAEFYGRLVGLEIAELSADRAVLRAPAEERPLLVLDRASRPGRVPVAATGLFHTAFRYQERADLALRLTRLEPAGARLTGAADHGVSEALYLDDPDGIGIELYWDRPRRRWPEPEPGERIRMFTEPLDLAALAEASAGADGEKPGPGVEIGHVHLKVADTGEAERFWTGDLGMELMTRFGPQASFLAWDGYHHHVGVNSWHSLGATREPTEGPGLERLVVRAEAGAAAFTTPDGIAVEVAEAGP